MRSSILFELKGNLHVGGFRPFMWKIASEAGLSGWIANSEQGVLLRLEGEEEQISEFIRKIPSAVPNAFYMKEIRLVRREPSGPLDLRNIGFRVTGEDNKVPLINPDKAPCISRPFHKASAVTKTVGTDSAASKHNPLVFALLPKQPVPSHST